MATTSPAFPYKTWRAVDIKKKNWLGQKADPPKEVTCFGGGVTLLFLHINTLAHPAGSAWSRQDKQSMRDRCCLALRSGKGFKFFLITIANIDWAGRMTFFTKTTFLHKTGALRNVVNETLRHRKSFLRMNTKFFFLFANTVQAPLSGHPRGNSEWPLNRGWPLNGGS